MRIALFVQCFYPRHIYGTEAYTLSLAQGLKARGHDVTIVTCNQKGDPLQEKFIEEYVWDGVNILSYDKSLYTHRSIQETYDQPSMRPIHRNILGQLQPDLIHVTHLLNHTIALLEVAKTLQIPTFATFTDFFGVCFAQTLETARKTLCSGPERSRANCIECYLKSASTHPSCSIKLKFASHPFFRRTVATTLASIDTQNAIKSRARSFPSQLIKRPDILCAAYSYYRGAIAPSLFLRDIYRLNGHHTNMYLSHFGIDIDRRAKPIRTLGAPIVIGFAGQIVPHKGLHLVIKAFRYLNPSKLKLKIWGSEHQDPDYVAELKYLAKGLPVEFLGTFSVSEISAVLSQIDVLSIPSTWHENSPLTLLQSLASHTPVIISNVAGLTEFVSDGVSGFTFERGNAKSLAICLRRFAENDGLAAEMSLRTHYERTSADMVSDVEKMYKLGLEQSAF